MVDSVVEENTHDEVKLKKPFRIQVTKSETIIKYPMTYIGVRPILEKRPTNLTEDVIDCTGRTDRRFCVMRLLYAESQPQAV